MRQSFQTGRTIKQSHNEHIRSYKQGKTDSHYANLIQTRHEPGPTNNNEQYKYYT